jgi:peptide/nickel transport system substrate-binding protein
MICVTILGVGMRRLLFVIISVVLTSWYSISPSNAAKDELVIGTTQFPSSFHPNIDSMMAKSYVHAMTSRPFTVFDQSWKLVCMLCTKLPTLENGLAVKETTPDGKIGIAVTYTIHPGATWGDGVPVTTKDVLFTWSIGRHSKSGIANIEFYRSLYKIDVSDDKTFTMHFDKLSFDYNGINDFRLIPKHIDEENFSNPETYKNRTAFNTDTTNKALYFGPYRISKVVSGSHILLEINPTWFGNKPQFKRIVIRVIENTAALEANLLSGGIDMIAGELGLNIDQAIAFEKRHGKKYNVLFKPGLIYEHIDLNLSNPILSDIRVRQALVHAIDREAISNRLFAGRQPAANSSVNPLDWVYAKDLKTYDYAPKRAQALLDEAGWNIIKGGTRYNSDGDKLTLQIMTTAGNRTRELVEQVLQSQWKSIGVNVTIKNEPARVFFGQTVTERRFPALAMFAWISSPENVPRTTLHSSHIPTSDNNFAGQNYTGFKNAEMDQLLEDIEVELDRDIRKKQWRRLQEIYIAEVPVIPLYYRARTFILPHWLHGIEPTGHMNPTPLWVENWSVRN